MVASLKGIGRKNLCNLLPNWHAIFGKPWRSTAVNPKRVLMVVQRSGDERKVLRLRSPCRERVPPCVQIMKDKKHKDYWKTVDECSAQLNVKPRLFDFREFDLKERQRALKQALASTGSTQTGSKAVKLALRPGEPQSKAVFGDKKPRKGQKLVENSVRLREGP
jgi:hypothetical protein